MSAPTVLKFVTSGNGWQRTAYDRVTGLGFVITRVAETGPRGGRVWRYEIESSHVSGGGVRVEYVERLDTAKRRCQQIVDSRTEEDAQRLTAAARTGGLK